MLVSEVPQCSEGLFPFAFGFIHNRRIAKRKVGFIFRDDASLFFLTSHNCVSVETDFLLSVP